MSVKRRPAEQQALVPTTSTVIQTLSMPSLSMATMSLTVAAGPSAACTASRSRPAVVVAAPRCSTAPRESRTDRPRLACRSVETETIQKSDNGCMFPDEEAMLAMQGFAISPDDLVAKAKEFLSTAAVDPSTMEAWLADDFEFTGPVVGPLGKEELLRALTGFDLLTGFPDLQSNFHHFRACPYEPGRVWFTWRPKGTNSGKLMGAIEPTGIVVEAPPQTHSLKFNEEGKVVKQTVGYVHDRQLGNTGGLGGIYGLLWAVGSPLPFPEANPWKKSKRYRVFQWITPMLRSFGGAGKGDK